MKPTFRLSLILSAAVALVLVLSLVTVALASPGADSPNAAPKKPGPTHSTSYNWAGYAIETNLSSPATGVVTDVQGSWTVPTVTSSSHSSSTYSAIWVGIDGYSDGTVEQIGTEQDVIKGTAYYSVWYEMYPSASVTIPHDVAPGDQIDAEVSYNGSAFVLTISDTTKGWSYSITKTATAERSSAEWVVEAPFFGRILPLADFGTVTLTDCSATLDTHTGGITDQQWQDDPLTMVSANGRTILAAPTAPADNGSSFSVTYGGSGNGNNGHKH